ncbi:MAG: thioredoxin domain-containing protein [Candidatus Nealsonbacteria bacterium]
MKSLSDKEFEQKVFNSKKLVLVDFWAPWCKACVKNLPVLEKYAKDHADKFDVYKINVAKNNYIANRYQVLSLPTILVFRNKKIIRQIVGSKISSDLEKLLHISNFGG